MRSIRYGIWNTVTERFCFGIRTATKVDAYREFYEKANVQPGSLWKYEVKVIPKNWKNPKNPNYAHKREAW